MYTNFTKSLDRPVDIFGMKGKWIIVFLSLAGISVFLGLVVGACTSTGIGICVLLIGAASSFVACLVFQGQVSHRQLGKYLAMSKIYPAVFRRERLNYILLNHNSEQSWFYKAQTLRDKRDEIEREKMKDFSVVKESVNDKSDERERTEGIHSHDED